MSKLRFVVVVLFGSALMLGPVSVRAAQRESIGDITITRDGQFDQEHGVRSGRGTVKSPFVISGWDLHHIDIADTTKAVKIVNNNITGTLTLNWIGPNVLVERNDIADLRVNENIPRWGAPTAGVIQKNSFGVVGQLRHFDGTFIYNTVGNPAGTTIPFFNNGLAVNFDGFNGAYFAHNTIYGPVEARLHGHHHSSGYNMPSHMHAGSADDHGMVDHSQRYHQVVIEKNHIITKDSSFALSYVDTNHAGNDRTAASETNPNLNAPHVHHTIVHIMDNKLEGGGILVDVFNAQDELHPKLAWGEMHITGNDISLQRGQLWPFESVYGIDVRQARGVKLSIIDNVINAPAPQYASYQYLKSWEISGAGVSLQDLDQGNVLISGAKVSNLTYGVQASQLTKSVRWTIAGLKTSGVEQPVGYDTSVANKPKQR